MQMQSMFRFRNPLLTYAVSAANFRFYVEVLGVRGG